MFYQECSKGCKYDFIEYIDSYLMKESLVDTLLVMHLPPKNESALDWMVRNKHKCRDPLFGKSVRTFGSKRQSFVLFE